MAELLPADLMFDILLRLPVTTLVRLRRVCKGWRDLIDSRSFAKLHSNDPPYLLMLHHLPNNKAYDVVDLSLVCKGGSSPLAFRELPVPGQGEIPYYVDHCNGLFCIADRTGVLLWNPATGKQFQLGLPREELWNWGFGYDKDSDDYKVVAFEWAETDAENGRYLLWIYSLKSRSRKCIDDVPYRYVGLGSCGVFVGGALHYPVAHPESNVDSIGALHLGKLEFNLVPTPDYNSDMCLNYFGALDGRLCVIYYSNIIYGGDEFDLWIMKEYGVKESWTKLIRCASYRYRLMPLTYLENEEVLLFNSEMEEYELKRESFGRRYEYNVIVGYEFKTRSFGRPYDVKTTSFGEMHGRHLSFRPYVYAPSLVSPQIDIWQVIVII